MSKQVSMDTIDELKRCLTVHIPGDSVESEVKTRLQSLAGTIKIDGFRPGKVPINVVETKYGARIRDEVANDLVQKGFQEALMEQEVQIAGQPKLEVKPYENGHDIEFSATFEVYPEVKIPAFNDIEVERPQAEINAQDVDQVIERMRLQKAMWTVANRAAEEGDQVFIDYKQEDAQDDSGLDGRQISVVIGSGVLPENFEQQLVGKTAGEEFSVEIDFAPDYVDADLAGRQVKYAVTVISVSTAELPDVGEAFARDFGIESGDLAQLREEVTANMQRELEAKVGALLKSSAFDLVNEHVNIQLPTALVDAETNNMTTQLRERIKTMGQSGQQANMPADEELRAQAKKNVTIGLLISELTKKDEITVSHEQIRQEVEKIADLYEDPAQITQWYYADMSRLASIEFKLAEIAFVDWVLAQGKVTETSLSFDALMNRAA